MEDLMRSALVDLINERRGGHLPEWTEDVIVVSEETVEKVFDIVDTKNNPGGIVRQANSGQATYYNGDEAHTYRLKFVKYEEYIDQFKKPAMVAGGKDNDWCKGASRPDYLCYSVDDSEHFIIHELSEGSIRSKLSDARNQLTRCVQFLMKSPKIKQYLQHFKKRICYLSVPDGVRMEYSPNGMADSFSEIYKNIPDPNPIKCRTFERNGFEAYETKVVRL